MKRSIKKAQVNSAKRAPTPRGTAEPSASGHSIRATSRLAGIELDTLRVWERRYGFPKPQRSQGGSRVYSDADVAALKLIARALELGYRAGEVVGRPSEALAKLVAEISRSKDSGGPVATIESLIGFVSRDDVGALRAELRQAAAVLGPRRFVMEIAHPTAVRIGALWSEGKAEVRHEHLLTECLSSQLQVLMSAYEDREGAPRVLLTSLPGERHGLGLEMIEVYLAVSRITPLLLGVDTPAEQIVEAAHAHSVAAVGLLVTEASDLKRTAKQIRWVRSELPRRVPVWIGGGAAAQLGLGGDGVRIIATWPELEAAISALRVDPR